jgi:tRNA(Ile)-lysidine synthase
MGHDPDKCRATSGWAVACSGGPDSLALLHLLTLTAQPLNRAVHALIIDHGLRPDSAQEAEHTATIAQDLGATPHLLRLSWAEKPTTGLQEKARDARHALLRHSCQQP